MIPFSFVHAADLHLGTPFTGIASCDSRWSQILQEAPFGAFDNILQLCLDRAVDFLVLAGDVYDNSEQDLRVQIRLREGLARLGEKGIHTYIATGNHDYGDSGTERLRWPETVHFFPKGEVASFFVLKNEQKVAEIQGLSYPRQNPSENYAPLFHKSSEGLFTIGVLHSNIGGQPGYDNYAPSSVGDLIASGVDYWALGHVHKQVILSEDVPVIAYPGTTQGRSPRSTGEKGCYLVEVGDFGTKLSFVPTAKVLWHQMELDISSWEQVDELFDAVEEGVGDLANLASSSLIVRLILSGRGPMHQELRDIGSRLDILEELRARSYQGWNEVWFDELIVVTSPDIDKTMERESGTITGDYLEILERLKNQIRAGGGSLYSELFEALSELYQSKKVRPFLTIPRPEQLAEHIEAAENIGLDLLIGGGE